MARDLASVCARAARHLPLFPVLLAAAFGCGSSRADSDEALAGPVFLSADVGAVGQAGSVSGSEGVLTVRASGTDIWDAADAFHFYSTALSGDGEMAARIASLAETDAWAKAGIMVRETLDASSRFVMAVVTPAQGASLQHRSVAGGACSLASGPNVKAPCWIRLQRAGDTFTSSVSTDGVQWTSMPPVTLVLPRDVLIGLCATAHNNSALTTAVFDSVLLDGRAVAGPSGGPGTIGTDVPGTPAADRPMLASVAFSSVSLNDAWWKPRIATNHAVNLPMMFQGVVDNHNIDNFSKAAHLMDGNHDGFLWADSDVYKILEGMARSIRIHPAASNDMLGKLNATIAKIAAAQVKTAPYAGYIDTYIQLGMEGRGGGNGVQPWQDLKSLHEDYCHGHLIEAAIAHYHATGRETFLDVARKLADHMSSWFGDGKHCGVPGHQEAELALFRLWNVPGKGKASDYDLARFYLDERGRRSAGRGIFGEYCQDLDPIRASSEPLGHAVRGPYMWAGAADLARASGDTAMLDAVERIWNNIVDRKMYVTGGTGHYLYNEGYGPDHDLASDAAYNETCSACATIFLGLRLANLRGDARYTDVMERILYNVFSASHSLAGRELYYKNYMIRFSNRVLGRPGIACCATNIVRTLPAISGYQYATKAGDGIWVHLYIAGQADIPYAGRSIGIRQETNYPWDGAVKMTMTLPGPAAFTLRLRIPEWATGAGVTVNGSTEGQGPASKGYLPVSRTWRSGDVVQLNLPMPIRRVYPHAKVAAHQGRAAIARGPLVYCLETDDNPVNVHRIVVPPGATLAAEFDGGLLGGVAKIRGTGQNADNGQPVDFTMIPYAVWDNRNRRGDMCVMVPETPQAAATIIDRGRLANATVSASVVGGDANAVKDGILPMNNNDAAIPRFTWQARQGTDEWIQLDFPQAIPVWRSDLHWYLDAACDYPQSLSHEYWDGGAWRPFQMAHDYLDCIDLFGGHFAIVRFANPAATTKVRLKVRLKAGKSAGLLEWRLPE